MTFARRSRAFIPGALRRRLYDVLPMRRRRWRRVPGIERVSASDIAVLTFDDGPSPDGTPQALDALEQVGATATFFVVGEQLRAHPELGREIVARGHDVGLHGFVHERPDLLTEAAARSDLATSMEAFEEILGLRPRWYRPPFGRCTSGLAEECMNCGLEVVYWSTWGFDWEEASPQLIAARVERDLRAGEVVLLHDTAVYNDRETPESTVAAIPLIAAAAGVRGLRLVLAHRSASVMSERRRAPERVLIVCSPGGHLLEMLALEPAWEDLDHLWVSYGAPDVSYLLTLRRVELVHGPTNRHIGNAVRNFPAAWRILRSYRPDTILSTGAGVALPFFVLGWLLRKRLVFVESLARVDDISLTGRLVYPLCDEFFVQWPTAQRLKRARWEGNIL